MGTKPQRPRPRQERARQIVETACGLIGITGTRLPGGHVQEAYAGGFNVWKTATSTGSFVMDIWGPPTGHKLFSCELKPDGQIYLRSFRRGVCEEEFLSQADAVVKAARVEGGPELVGFPTGGGKTAALCDPARFGS